MSEILIPVNGRQVAARVQPAQHSRGTVLFVRGSGVDRHDPSNQVIANKLRRAGFDTVLLDLLEPHEAVTAATCSTSSCRRRGSRRRWIDCG